VTVGFVLIALMLQELLDYLSASWCLLLKVKPTHLDSAVVVVMADTAKLVGCLGMAH